MFPHTAHKVYPFRPLQHDNLANQPINKHILPVLVLVDIFNSHIILHLLLRFSIEGDTKMCVTDYCPHSYSYRMILIRTHFIFISLARFCIWYTVLELTIELVRIFDTIKRAKASGSFHCCLLVGRIWYLSCHLLVGMVRCLKLAWRVRAHTVDLFSMVCCSLYSLLNLSASFLPSIERQVGLFIVVCSWKSRCPCLCHPHQ